MLKALDEFTQQQQRGIKDVINMFQDARQGYYESLSTFETFGKGWTRRVSETTASALKMA